MTLIEAGSGGFLTFVSDLHLGDARQSLDEHDPSLAFARFVEELSEHLIDTGSGIRLVVLGDMFDLTRVEARVPPAEAVAASIDRLDRIADAQAEIFQALGRFISGGGFLDIVVGNHDLDLAHPAVQEQFIGRLGVRSLDPGATRVTFHRWFLYLRDVVFAEHGHRYHDINVVPVPDGCDVPGLRTPADVPLTAFLESYLRAVRTRGSWRTLARDLGRLTGSLLARTARHGSHRKSRGCLGDRARLRDAADPDLDGDALIAIDALSARLGTKTAFRVGTTILGPPVRLVLPYGAVAGLLGLVLRGMPLAGPAVVLASAAALTTLIRNRRGLWPPPRSTGYALEAAEDLRHTLEGVGAAVPFYILGHTHVPARVEFEGPGKRSTYFNTGAWDAAERDGRGYPFVRVTRGETGELHAELLWWRSRASG
jgi:UDP-2,3-diacylglucosamine pyrophosphatase LpxH